jgi:uncharacterized pyridoxal phosphate-containing UPF0001 family protein
MDVAVSDTKKRRRWKKFFITGEEFLFPQINFLHEQKKGQKHSMEEVLSKFGYWIVTSIIALAGLMIWGRINDKFKSVQDQYEVMAKTIDEVKKEHENINVKLGTMEVTIIRALGELKDALEKKYVQKEFCAFIHKAE